VADLLPGDRVVIDYSWPSTKITTIQGINPPFDLNKGDKGTVVTDEGGSVYNIEFDKGPGHLIRVAKHWLLSIPKDATPKMEASKQCSCSLMTIMAQGCVCGHIKRYVPPHKRIFDLKKEETK